MSALAITLLSVGYFVTCCVVGRMVAGHWAYHLAPKPDHDHWSGKQNQPDWVAGVFVGLMAACVMPLTLIWLMTPWQIGEEKKAALQRKEAELAQREAELDRLLET